MLIYANPSTVPARRRTKKKGATMKRKRSSTRRASSRRRVHRNPSVKRRRVHRNPSFKARSRRRVHRNPSRGGMFKGILGELASMNGVALIGSAVAAPIVTDFVVGYLPTNMKTGYTGLIAKAAVVAAGAWALDRFVKSRHAAIGFAAGGLGKVIADGINLYKVNSVLPPAKSEAQQVMATEIAKNPSAVQSLMDGSFDSLNGYTEAPQQIGMAGYEVGLGGFESLN